LEKKETGVTSVLFIKKGGGGGQVFCPGGEKISSLVEEIVPQKKQEKKPRPVHCERTWKEKRPEAFHHCEWGI